MEKIRGEEAVEETNKKNLFYDQILYKEEIFVEY